MDPSMADLHLTSNPTARTRATAIDYRGGDCRQSGNQANLIGIQPKYKTLDLRDGGFHGILRYCEQGAYQHGDQEFAELKATSSGLNVLIISSAYLSRCLRNG